MLYHAPKAGGPPALADQGLPSEDRVVESRVERLRRQVRDGRGGQVVFLSHCLLNHNVRYLGGAEDAAGARDLVDGYLGRGVGICQMPCPEQRAWGGVLKRWMLVAYGAGGSWRGPVVRALLPLFVAYTRVVYARLAREVAVEAADYRDCGMDVVGVVGIAGSPSCGARMTLDLPASVDVLSRCPLARLDRRFVTEEVVAEHEVPGQGLFVTALQREFTKRALESPVVEHDFATRSDSWTGDRTSS